MITAHCALILMCLSLTVRRQHCLAVVNKISNMLTGSSFILRDLHPCSLQDLWFCLQMLLCAFTTLLLACMLNNQFKADKLLAAMEPYTYKEFNFNH